MEKEATNWTLGIKSPWQRISILFALAVITALSTTVTVIYWQSNKDLHKTVDYERVEKEEAQKEVRDCETDKLNIYLSKSSSNDSTLKRQDTLIKVLKIKS